MKKIVLLVLVSIFISCNNSNSKGFYPNGNLKLSVELNKNGIPNGVSKEYYFTGELKQIITYDNGVVKDSVYSYYKSGVLKEKGTIDSITGFKKGDWFFYDSLGGLANINEYKIINNELYLNQKTSYNQDGLVDENKSSFFKIEIPDTLSLGWNSGKLKKYHSFNEISIDIKNQNNYLAIIVENEYPNIGKSMDTFGVIKNDSFFGLYGNKLGHTKIKGIIFEKTWGYEEISPDSFGLKVIEHEKYFEKDVYIKDTLATSVPPLAPE